VHHKMESAKWMVTWRTQTKRNPLAERATLDTFVGEIHLPFHVAPSRPENMCSLEKSVVCREICW